MSGLQGRLFDVTTLNQLCIVVPDLQRSMESMWSAFGIGPWSITHHRPSDLSDMFHRGKPTRFGMSIARAGSAGMEIELIEPTEGDSTYCEFLKEHEEGGVHHLGWHLVDDFALAVRVMQDAGFPCVTSARTYRSHFGYFDTIPILGAMLEVSCRNESIPVRPPECVWP